MASFSVVSNIASANAQTNLQATNISLNRALSRLSSGYRINQSGDDAAGLAVANSYRNDVAIMNQGVRNANDGLSKLQIKGQRARQHRDRARPDGDAGHPGVFDRQRREHHQAVRRV
jgi:hypothetical protein